MLFLNNPGLVSGSTVELDNAVGAYGGGALSGAAVVEARVDLGDTGSILAGGGTTGSGSPLTLRGQVVGGDLIKVGSGRVSLESASLDFTGELRVLGGEVRLDGATHLRQPAGVTLAGPTAVLDVVENGVAGSQSDRIDDAMRVTLAGGTLRLTNADFTANTVAETLGELRVAPGQSTVAVLGGELTASSLTREAGGVLVVQPIRAGDRVRVADGVALDDGVLPWSVDTGNRFLTHTRADGFTAATLTDVTTLNGRGATENVRLTGGDTLTADARVNTLTLEPSSGGATLNLGGRTLTLDAGGVAWRGGAATISNGRVTSGGSELLLFGGNPATLDADVIDGDSGPLTLVVARNRVTLGGSNTHTGGTLVLGELIAASAAALPAGSDVTVRGGTLTLGQIGNVSLGELRLQSGGDILNNGGATLTAARIITDGGTLRASLAGGFDLDKTGPGSLLITQHNDAYNGTMTLGGGVTTFNRARGLGTGTARVLDNTLLRYTNPGLIDNASLSTGTISLEGGAIQGSFANRVQVLTTGRVDRQTFLNGELAGEGTLRLGVGATLFLRGDASDFTGVIDVDAAATAFASRSDALGGGTLTLRHGGTFAADSGLSTFAGAIHSDGGRVRGIGGPVSLDGPVTLAGPSVIDGNGGRITFTGDVTLADDSYTFITDANRSSSPAQTGTVFAGNVAVRGTARVQSDGLPVLFTGTLRPEGDATLVLDIAELAADIDLADATAFGVLRCSTPDPLTFAAGRSLRGTGTLRNGVVVADGGTLAPGNSIGTLIIDGPLTLETGATTAIEVGPASADRVTITGAATLGGSLSLSLTGGSPARYDSATILTGSSIQGEFNAVSGVNQPGLPASDALAVTYTPTAVRVTRAVRGDSDIDRDVDIADFNALASNFGSGTQSDHARWAQGNFDGDADVDTDDLNLLTDVLQPPGLRGRLLLAHRPHRRRTARQRSGRARGQRRHRRHHPHRR